MAKPPTPPSLQPTPLRVPPHVTPYVPVTWTMCGVRATLPTKKYPIWCINFRAPTPYGIGIPQRFWVPFSATCRTYRMAWEFPSTSPGGHYGCITRHPDNGQHVGSGLHNSRPEALKKGADWPPGVTTSFRFECLLGPGAASYGALRGFLTGGTRGILGPGRFFLIPTTRKTAGARSGVKTTLASRSPT